MYQQDILHTVLTAALNAIHSAIFTDSHSVFVTWSVCLWCEDRWPFSEPEWANLTPQTSQTKGFSPVCVRMWVRMLHACVKARPHTGQCSGFSAQWMSRVWRTSCCRLLNRFGHALQACGRSSECTVRTCVRSPPITLNWRPHWSQWCGNSPLPCMRVTCIRKTGASLKPSPHWLQTYGRTSECVHSW